jgi:tetratricopeptide (TPR) repeat protein
MLIKSIRKIAGIMIVSAFVCANVNAQDRNAVIAAYNEGATLVKTDVPGAIRAFENCITLADQVGETAADLKQKAAGVLPGLYVKAASAAISEKKPAPEIMKAAKLAVAKAEKYGTETHKSNAGKLLVQAYNNLATGYFSQNDYANALLAFDSVLTVNPDYVNAYYNKALVYIKQNNSDDFEKTIDLYIEKLKSGNDTTRIKQASTLALEYFRAAGSKANQADNLDEALTLLNKAAKYGNDKDLFYYFADVYNKQKNFDSGAEYAQKGLALETGDAEAKAKFYYQLAVAQAGKGRTADACASFKNAMYGPFAEASKAQSKNLKCQ